LSEVAGAGGVLVQITSDDPGILLVSGSETSAGGTTANVLVPEGAFTFSYVIHGITTGSGGVTATAAGHAGTQTVHTVAPLAAIFNSLPATVAPDARVPFTVITGILNPAGTGFQVAQQVRTGGPALQFRLVSTNPSAGRFATSGGQSATALVEVKPGDFSTPATIADGGVELQAGGEAFRGTTFDILLNVRSADGTFRLLLQQGVFVG
jgi:hypothetical protein